MRPRNLSARLEALESRTAPQDIPRFWLTPSWCELTYAEGRVGEIFHREPSESKEAFVARVEASTTSTVLHGFKPLTNEEWEQIAQAHYANRAESGA